MILSGLVVVRRVQGLLRAEAVKAYLESHGIPAALDYESAGRAIGLTLDGLGEVRVVVPGRLARRARRLLLARPAPTRPDGSRRHLKGPRGYPGRSRGRPGPARPDRPS